MRNILNNIDLTNLNNIDLDSEYKEALKDTNFKEITKTLKINEKELKKYTSIIQECSKEYSNCKECKCLLECKNKVEGFCYLPVNNNGNLSFTYRPCKYKEANDKKIKVLENVKYFNTPLYVKEANLENIYKTDKKRFEAINYLMDFLDDTLEGKTKKGLYLHGNFGCGKTYLISAIFNELSKNGVKSAIVFWPEFLRQAFYDDFNEKFDYIKKVSILLIDDIGAEGLTAWNRDEILCPLLQYRMDNNLTTFFTSNLNINELTDHLANSKSGVDVVKAGRIISRIEQLTEDMEMLSKNLRK